MRALKLLSLVFCSASLRTFFSIENDWPDPSSALYLADTMPQDVSIPLSFGAVFVQVFPTCLHRELLSWSEVVPLGIDALHVAMDSQWIVEVKKSFACSTDLEVDIDHVSDVSSFRNRLSCCAFCSSIQTRLLRSQWSTTS